MNIRKPPLKRTVMLSELLNVSLLFSGKLLLSFKSHVAAAFAVALLCPKPFFLTFNNF